MGLEYDTLFKDEEFGLLFEDYNKFGNIFTGSTDGLDTAAAELIDF